MKPVSPVAIAVIIAAGFALMGFFIGNGLRDIRPTGRYVNVRGLSEREVTADTAQLSIHMESAGSAPNAISSLAGSRSLSLRDL